MRSGPRSPRLAPMIGLALGACGGSARPVDPGPSISATPLTRVVVEDSELDDGAQVVGARGHLEDAAVDAALAPHRTALTRCYTQKVGRRTWLGGRVVLRWAVGADGALTSVRITESDLGAWPVESCLLSIARQVSFGTPIGGAAEVTLPLELSVAKPLAISQEPPAAKATSALLAKLDACAKGKAKLAMPHDVALTIYLGPRGAAASIGFASAMDLDDDWAACAEKAALGWRVPESKGQVTKLALRYRPR